MDRNRIFIDRTRNVGVITTADAINWGFTGPILRSTGAPRDLRKDTPYLAYAELDFEVPVGINGDNYDRYYVPDARDGRVGAHDPPDRRACCPTARSTSTTAAARFRTSSSSTREIESLINHFKLVMDGPQVPAGEVYVAHEAPNGELGFYLVSDGRGTPYKVHVRSPSFVHMGGLHRLLEGYQLADIIPTFGSVNMIGGECDR